jgi:hypothetical protein
MRGEMSDKGAPRKSSPYDDYVCLGRQFGSRLITLKVALLFEPERGHTSWVREVTVRHDGIHNQTALVDSREHPINIVQSLSVDELSIYTCHRSIFGG